MLLGRLGMVPVGSNQERERFVGRWASGLHRVAASSGCRWVHRVQREDGTNYMFCDPKGIVPADAIFLF